MTVVKGGGNALRKRSCSKMRHGSVQPSSTDGLGHPRGQGRESPQRVRVCGSTGRAEKVAPFFERKRCNRLRLLEASRRTREQYLGIGEAGLRSRLDRIRRTCRANSALGLRACPGDHRNQSVHNSCTGRGRLLRPALLFRPPILFQYTLTLVPQSNRIFDLSIAFT